MPDTQKDLQQQVLRILQSKLECAILKTSKLNLTAKPVVFGMVKNKLKFVFVKDTLEKTLGELELWQTIHQPHWFQLIKFAPPSVDGTLNILIATGPKAVAECGLVARQFRRAFKEPSDRSQSVFIDAQELRHYNTAAILSCTAMVATRSGDSCKQLIIDPVVAGSVQKKDAREFARRLRYSDPFVFGLLGCKGVVRSGGNMAFVFRVPEGYSSIRSVRDLLLSGKSHESLSDRFEMAKQLANAVYYVHLYGFVHKNIRPETILSVGKADDTSLPCTACLVGFQVIRNADGRTFAVAGAMEWETNIYRHPLRQGDNAEYYVMQHDVYSLGVCLLEIGLWESFVAYNAGGPTKGAAQPSTALGLPDGQQLDELGPFAVKEHLVTLSRSSMLRGKMGSRYSRVVETCLTCLDADNVDFGDEQEFQDEDGVAVGVRYIEKVLGILNGICL